VEPGSRRPGSCRRATGTSQPNRRWLRACGCRSPAALHSRIVLLYRRDSIHTGLVGGGAAQNTLLLYWKWQEQAEPNNPAESCCNGPLDYRLTWPLSYIDILFGHERDAHWFMNEPKPAETRKASTGPCACTYCVCIVMMRLLRTTLPRINRSAPFPPVSSRGARSCKRPVSLPRSTTVKHTRHMM
jgi:hypothetical protein